MQKYSASAPGKIIISGEHSVVAGAPAIVIPTQQRLCVTINKRADASVVLESNDFAELTCTVTDIQNYKPNPENKFNIALYTMHELKKAKPLDSGIDLKIKSDIPIGCGFGSSAALVVAIIKAYCKMQHTEMAQHDLVSMAIKIENIQHAKSSGIDVKVATYDSSILYADEKINFKQYKQQKWAIINTGARQCSTADCVRHSQKILSDEPKLLAAFASVCKGMDRALTDGSEDLASNIRYNQLLLNKIGVTPMRVQNFITAANKLGMAVKITGAGAISGDNAGALIALWHPQLQQLCEQYDYSLQQL
jgi:mevalonate kinase